jgi:hypothetical protein
VNKKKRSEVCEDFNISLSSIELTITEAPQSINDIQAMARAIKQDALHLNAIWTALPRMFTSTEEKES